jgi:hypothetical protein
MTNDTAKLLLSKIMEKRSDWLGFEPLRAFLNAPGNMAQSALNAGQSFFTPTPAQAASNADDTARIAARHSAGENALIKQLAMLGLGVGTGVGGIYAINQALKTRKKDPVDTEVDLPYPVKRPKMAAEDKSWFSYLMGTQPEKPSLLDNPLFLPTAGAASLAALYGGFKGSSSLADVLLNRQQANELASAKDDFQKALLGAHDQPLEHDPVRKKKMKTASMVEVSQEIDALFNLVEKRAKDEPLGWSSGNLLSDIVKAITPAYTTYALAGGIGTGALAYDMTRKHSRAEALKKALRDRSRMKYEISPPELNVVADAIDPDDLEKKRPSSVV